MKNMLLFLLGLVILTTSCLNETEKEIPDFKNSDFYDSDGVFLEEKAKDAILLLAEYHNYHIFPDLREKLWVSDYGTGKFAQLGLAAYMFMNNETDQYMLMDLFLLPGQMLPEHWHLDGESNPAKLEGWLVRNGMSYIVGEGKDNLASYPEIEIPECHSNSSVMTKHVIKAYPGSFTPQSIVYSRHWQFAGSEGAIITEVANVHTDNAVRHTDKEINDHFLGI